MEAVIKTAIEDVMSKLGFPMVDFAVEHPADCVNGDYATNVALVVAKAAGQAPREIAQQFLSALDGQIEYVDRIEIAGPGFINFYLARDFFVAEAMRAESDVKKWSESNDEEGKIILFEYTSPNLFKPLHIGNLVGNIIGESVSRLLENAGADLKRINYPSDIGPAVAKAVWGIQKTGGDVGDINALGEAYRFGNEAFENDEAAKAEIEAINQKLYSGEDAELSRLREEGIQTSKNRLDEICVTLGTHFDNVIYESEAGPVGQEIVKDKLAEGVFVLSNGAVVFEGEKHGLHTRVFLNSQGLPTYEAKDLGNFVLKQEIYPKWDEYFVVTGSEQTEYFKVLYAAAREVFPEIKDKLLKHIPTGFLTLTTGKMSSRKGNVLTGESLLEELMEEAKSRAAETRAENIDELAKQIAVAALKYQILRHRIGSDIVFDKERALSFEGDSGPYLQYTHARIGSVLEKAKSVGVLPSVKVEPEAAYPLERVIYRFPEVVEVATQEYQPHYLVTYLTELAGEFNSFYAAEKIADANDEYAPYKAALALAVKNVLARGLYLLGMEAPERM